MKRRSQPPGFRFHPTHTELVMYYLNRKVTKKKLPKGVISELDVYKYAPWDLPDKSCMKNGDLKWYFFCPRKKKYANGDRMNRANEIGFWKSTGKDRSVSYSNKKVGQIKTLTFFRGKAPKGDPTDWVMHEYRIEEKNSSLINVAQDAYVLCVIFQKDGPGPRNGAQYGAPFKEEDWEDDGLMEFDYENDDSPSVLPSKEPLNSFAPGTSTTPSSNFGCPSASCISENLASTPIETPQIASGSIAPVETPLNVENGDDGPLNVENDDDGFTMQEIFPEDEDWNLNSIDGFQATVAASNNTYQIHNTVDGLEDIGGYAFGDWNAYNSITGEASFDQMSFLELNDLNGPISSTFEVAKYPEMQMPNLNAAYSRSNVIEQPCFPFSSFGAANQHLPYQYPTLPNFNDQIRHPIDLGYPDAHMSASSQSAWLQENIHPNSIEGYNGYKAPWFDHYWNPP